MQKSANIVGAKGGNNMASKITVCNVIEGERNTIFSRYGLGEEKEQFDSENKG